MALTYSCIDWDALAQKCKKADWVETADSLPINDPAINELIGAIALLFATAWLFNFLLKFILNKR